MPHIADAAIDHEALETAGAEVIFVETECFV